jgi:hypothetical protein
MVLPPNFWRESLTTSDVHECDIGSHNASTSPCLGSSHPGYNENEALDSRYCIPDHFGPRCRACSRPKQYFDVTASRCVACPGAWRLGVLLGVAVVVALALGLCYFAVQRIDRLSRLTRRVSAISVSLSLQAKFKIFVSFFQVPAVTHERLARLGDGRALLTDHDRTPQFKPSPSSLLALECCLLLPDALATCPYFLSPQCSRPMPIFQVINALSSVFGVHLHRDFIGWLDAISLFNVDVLDVVVPGNCIGSMQWRLLLSALWPFGVVLALVLVLAVHALVECLLKPKSAAHLPMRTVYRSLYAFIFVGFLVLPSVSRSIFRTRQCESFGHDDATGQRKSYLLADLTVQCNDSDPVFRSLYGYFISFFVLWPVLVPLLFLGLVLRVAPYVRKHRITRLAMACRFLWRDYENGTLWWEVSREHPDNCHGLGQSALPPAFPLCLMSTPHASAGGRHAA